MQQSESATSSQTPIVAVVILGWNNRALLDECFASVYAQTYREITIIYVDNDSKDGSVAHVRANHPRVIVIETGRNTGFAVGNNIGFERALQDPSCGYVVALNTDATLAVDWTEKLVAFSLEHSDAAGLQGLTLNYHNRKLVDSTGIYVDMSAAPLQIGYNQPYDGGPSRKVFGVNAAAAMYTRAFLDKQPYGADYFDHDLFMYYEDVDIAARALVLGMSNYFCHDAVAYHMGSASSGGNPRFMLRMVHRNLPLVMLKNFPWSIIIRTLPGWTRAEFLRVLDFIRTKQFGLAKAIVLGRFQGLLLLPKFFMKRRRLARIRKALPADIVRFMRSSGA